MLTIDKEKMYRRKLDDLGKRYDALHDRSMKLELGETPPKRLAVLLKDVAFHVGTSIRYYRMRIDDTHTTNGERKMLEGNLRMAKETMEFTNWLVEQMK